MRKAFQKYKDPRYRNIMLNSFWERLKAFCTKKGYRSTFNEWLIWYGDAFIKRNPVKMYLFVGLLTVILYHLSVKPNLSDIMLNFSSVIIQLLGVEGFTDQGVKTTITTVLSSVTIIISLLSAIYVFTHREQKSVSPSASTDNSKNTLVSRVICLMIINILLGFLIVQGYNTSLSNIKNYVPSLEVTKSFYSRIILLCFLLLYLIKEFIVLIRYLFRTMSVENMLQDSVDQVSNILNSILEVNRSREFRSFKTDKYKKFHFSLESVFQNLKFVAEHNMNQEFEDNIKAFKTVIKKIEAQIVRDNIKYDSVSSYLLKVDGSQFIHAYNSALRSNLSLIGHLLKNQQYNKAKEAISLHYDMFLNSDEVLIKTFKISLNDFLYFLDTDDERQLLIFLEGLYKIPEINSQLTYKFLIMKLINKGQMKNLTNIVYDYEKFPNSRQQILIIFLQALIKSIEIANYEITGFMVKFLITNFRGKEIDRGLRVLNNDKIKGNFLYISVLEANETIDGINDDGVFPIKINEETFEYCLRKAYILLFGQHNYARREKLWFARKWEENGNEIQLGLAFKECSYSNYMISKTKAAASKYGLLFFEDSQIMKNIYKELDLKYPDSYTSKEPSLRRIICSLVKKNL